MSDRSTETSSLPSSPPPSSPPASQTQADETAVRPGFAAKVQAKLRDAAAEAEASKAAGTGPATSAAARAAAARGPRRARLRLTRVDPWSVMKTAFLLSIAFGIVTVVSVAMVWTVLDQAGVWSSVNSTIQEGIGGNDTASFDVEDYIGTSRVLGFTMLVAAVDVILLTAIATLAAFLYNMAAALLGGIEVTLAEDRSPGA